MEKVNGLIDQTRCKDKESCVCYGQSYLTAIESFYKKATECQIDLKHSRRSIEELNKFGKSKEPQWYQHPGVIAGGVVFSFSIGALLAYAVAKR